MEKSATTRGDDPEGSDHLEQRRVLRNRGYRRPFEDHRQTKRLFTPEIKRFLKSWLVRRRDNPYPSRDEKKGLAVQTGLTYIQICNWFANWRRKLKNAGTAEIQHNNTWGTLIKSYNTKAQGNVEQFSICSDDSIWEEQNLSDVDDAMDDGSSPPPLSYVINATAMDHSYSAVFHQENSNSRLTQEANHTSDDNKDTDKCSMATVTNGLGIDKKKQNTSVNEVNSRYKNLIMRRYLTDLQMTQDLSPQHKEEPTSNTVNSEKQSGTAKQKFKRHKRQENHLVELTKWLESAAKFKPGQNYITQSAKHTTWHSRNSEARKTRARNVTANNEELLSERKHQREELDAAEALTCLSTYC